jgi:diadenylate cyclase
MGAEIWHFIVAHYPQLLDTLLVAILLYIALLYTRGTKTSILLQAAVAFTILYVAAQHFHLVALAWLFEKLLVIAPVAAIVIFAPEIRAMLDRASRRSRFLGMLAPQAEVGQAGLPLIEQLAEAAEDLASRRIGALIVIEKGEPVDQHLVPGERLDALCSERLLTGLFDRHNPLHDGAVLIRDERIHSAGNFLPLADGAPPDSQMGTRHRAALGLVERSESLAIAVSEQRGEVSLAFRGRMARGLRGDQLAEQLHAILEPNENHSTLVPRSAARKGIQKPQMVFSMRNPLATR